MIRICPWLVTAESMKMSHTKDLDVNSWFLAQVTGGSIDHLIGFGHATVVSQALLTGLALSQALRFHASATDDPRILKLAVALMTVISW